MLEPRRLAATNAARFMAANADMISQGGAVTEACRDTSASWEALGVSPTLLRLMRQWDALHAVSVARCEQFWPLLLNALGFRFAAPPERVLALSADGNPDSCEWFPGARLNVAACAIEGPGHSGEAYAVVGATEEAPTQCAPTPSTRRCALHLLFGMFMWVPATMISSTQAIMPGYCAASARATHSIWAPT